MTIPRERLFYIILGAISYFLINISYVLLWDFDYITEFNQMSSLLPTQKNRIIPKTPRILCYINTIPSTYFTKAVHVNRTWAKRCTKTIFFSSKDEPTIPVLNLNLTKPESRMHLWSKIRKVLRYVYQYRNDYDFFFKCDDDTYLFYENLVSELSKRDPDDPFMTGHRFIIPKKYNYFSGGAGYVLSREALKRIVERAIDKHPDCPTYDEDKEDVKMSICGKAVGVKNYDALDEHKQSKFSWYSPDSFIKDSKWPVKKTLHGSRYHQKNLPPMSPLAISYHYVKPESMYLLDYAVYYLNVFQQSTIS